MFRRVDSHFGDAHEDVARLSEQLSSTELRGVLVFASPEQDLDVLARTLNETFTVPIVGCTGAGVFGPSGYLSHGIAAAGLYGAEVSVDTYRIEPLTDYVQQATEIGQRVCEKQRSLPSSYEMFVLLLVDGLSGYEERIVAKLHAVLPYVSVVGGSAADRMTFTEAKVLVDGRFKSNRAVLTCVSGPFRKAVFQSQHYKASFTRFVVTGANPDERIVYELDGEPAAKRLAEAVGVTTEQLTPSVLTGFPLLARWGHQEFVRGIRCLTPDGALKLYCGIGEGEVVCLGKADDPLRTLRVDLACVQNWLGEAQLDGTIGFDGVQRRLSFIESGIWEQVVAEYENVRMVGCGTFGEQVNARYVNNTLTGVAIAKIR